MKKTVSLTWFLLLSLMLLLVAPARAAVDLPNGDFEMGNMSGWTTNTLPAGAPAGWFVYMNPPSLTPLSSFPVEVPPDGSFAAVSDQLQPGTTMILYRDITLPTQPQFLAFQLYYESWSPFTAFGPLTAPSDLQQLRVELLRQGANEFSTDPADILETYFLSAQGTPAILSSTGYTNSLAEYRGMTVRLRFAVSVATFAQGPLFAAVDGVQLIVDTNNPPPSVSITSPTNDSVFIAPAAVTFTAEATDDDGVSYVQFLEGTNSLGILNNPPYSTTVNLTDGPHEIRAVAVDSLGAEGSSSFITINVFSSPLFTAEPTNCAVTWNTEAIFVVTATGTPAPTYQWRRNGNNLTNRSGVYGVDASTLVLAEAQFADAGIYDCVISNVVSTATSAPVTLQVHCPAITVGPSVLPDGMDFLPYFATNTAEGGAAPYTFSVIGTPPSGLMITSSGIWSGTPNQVGSFEFTIQARDSNGCTATTGYSVSVAGSPPILTAHPQSVTNVARTPVTFSAGALGTAPLRYQWRHGTQVIPGATANSYTIAEVTAGHAGAYTCEVTNHYGFAATEPAILSVAPAITVQPGSTTATVGDNVVFTFFADGQLPLNYQWQKNGANISGANGSSYSINSIVSSNAGSYSVVVSNAYGFAASDPAALTVNKASQTITFGTLSDKTYGQSSFTVSATTSSQLPVTFSSLTTGIVQVAGNTVTVVGTGAATLRASQDGDEDYLAATNVDRTFWVSKAPLTVTSDAKQRMYGDLNPVFTGSITGLQYADPITASYSTSADTGSAVGVYPITQALADPGDKLQNYEITTNNGMLLITNAPLRAVADAKIKASGASNPPLTGSLIGARNSGDGLTASFTTTATESSPAGAYPIYAAIEDPLNRLSNYSVTLAHSTLNVMDVPAIVTAPVSRTINQGERVTFSVTASGSATLDYQWFHDGNPIPGASSESYSIAQARLTDAGTYTVEVTNLVGSATAAAALVVQPDSTAPVVQVILPRPNGTYSNLTDSVLLINGTARDLVGVRQVLFSHNGGSLSEAALSAGRTMSNWTASLTLTPGTNLLQVYGVDLGGNTSSVSLKFCYNVTSPFTLNVIGTGTVVPTPNNALGTPSNGARLFLGRGYKLTAKVGPGTNWIFTNWTASVNGGPSVVRTNNPVFVFDMETNLVVNAVFITNPLMRYSGEYNGLFYEPQLVRHSSAGAIILNVTPRFTFSGKLLLEGNTVPISGKVNIDGTIHKVVSRATVNKGPLYLDLAMDFAEGTDTVSGTLADPTPETGWASLVIADRWTWQTNTGPGAVQYKNAYTFVIPPFASNTEGPAGYGYGTATIDITGKTRLMATLGDQLKVSQNTKLSKDGLLPFLVQSYFTSRTVTNSQGLPKNLREGRGMLFGWLSLLPNEAAYEGNTNLALHGPVDWICLGWTNGNWPNGFAKQDLLISSLHRPPTNTGTRIYDFTNTLVILSDGALSSPITNDIFLRTNSSVMVNRPVTNKFSMSLNPRQGSFSGVFTNVSSGSTNIRFGGVMLQDYNVGKGSFLNPSSTDASGKVEVNGSPDDSNPPPTRTPEPTK